MDDSRVIEATLRDVGVCDFAQGSESEELGAAEGAGQCLCVLLHVCLALEWCKRDGAALEEGGLGHGGRWLTAAHDCGCGFQAVGLDQGCVGSGTVSSDEVGRDG